MSSSKDFLDKMKGQAEEMGYSGGGGTVAKILIEIGLHRYVAGHDFWAFFKPLGDGDNEMERVGKELSGRLLEAGCTDSPRLGLKVTIFKDAIGRDPFKADLQEFIPDWQDGFGLMADAIETLELTIGQVFFGRFQYKDNPHHVKKGEAGKTDTDQDGKPRYPTIRLPVEKFTNETEAMAAAGKTGAVAVQSKWSDTLNKNYTDTGGWDLQISHIQADWDKLIEGEKPHHTYAELPENRSVPSLQAYLAKIYDCDPSDIEKAVSQTPF